MKIHSHGSAARQGGSMAKQTRGIVVSGLGTRRVYRPGLKSVILRLWHGGLDGQDYESRILRFGIATRRILLLTLDVRPYLERLSLSPRPIPFAACTDAPSYRGLTYRSPGPVDCARALKTSLSKPGARCHNQYRYAQMRHEQSTSTSGRRSQIHRSIASLAWTCRTKDIAGLGLPEPINDSQTN